MEHETLRPYAPPARAIHWIMALAMILVIPLGFAMLRVPSGPVQDQLFLLHESIGFTILVLAVVRILIRRAYAPPPEPASLPAMQRIAATAVHHLLYVIIVVQPLLGWLGTSAYGAPISIFGLFTLPPLSPKNEALSDIVNTTHQWVGYAAAVLVSVHILAGLWHGIVRQDGILSRMIPSLSRR